MFPVIPKYIDSLYVRNNSPVYIHDKGLVSELEKNANKIIALIHKGTKFTPTQPDILRIEKLMRAELQQQQSHNN